MRALLLSFCAAALGVAAAWGATKYEFRRPEQVVPVRSGSTPQAKVVVEGGNTHNFGTMQLGQTRSHTFVLRNVGDAPLELTAGRPSCKCTVSEFSTAPVLPGETREVLITWTPVGVEEKFRQRAPVFTNDPEKPEIALNIGGRVAEFYKLEPNPLLIGQFSPTEDNTYHVKVWGYQPTPWKFKSYQCQDSESAEFFNVEARDMTAEELASAPGSLNGQVLTITVKSGLPLGQVRQRLSISFNEDAGKPAEIPVTGKAVGDVTIVGKDVNTNGDYVDLGNIPSDIGRKSLLSLLVKGPHRDQVKFKIKEIDPANALAVTVGEPKTTGKSVNWPLTIEVPPGSESVNRLGSELSRLGRIELETGIPEVPNCVVKVRLAITNEQ
jgi:hypothetical protein